MCQILRSNKTIDQTISLKQSVCLIITNFYSLKQKRHVPEIPASARFARIENPSAFTPLHPASTRHEQVLERQ